MLSKHAGKAMLLSLWFVSVSAVATAQPPLPAQQKVQPAQFPQLAAQIRKDMQPGGRYLVNPDERSEVDGDLTAMEKLFAGHASLDELNPQQQVDLFNHQERINALLTKRDGDEKICHREPVVGSHMVQTVCTKRSDMEKTTRDTQQYWQSVERQQQVPRLPGSQN